MATVNYANQPDYPTSGLLIHETITSLIF